MKLKDYEIETIDQRKGHYKRETVKGVANMVETVHYLIFITAKACVIRRKRNVWRWVK